jgi:hypothetical protein
MRASLVTCSVAVLIAALAPGLAFAPSGSPGRVLALGSVAQAAEDPAPPDSVAAAVYSALIDQHYDRGLQIPLIISASSVDHPEDVTIDEHLRVRLQSALSPLSPETLAAMERFAPDPSILEPRLNTHRPCRIVSKTVLDSLFAFCPGGWDRFAEKFPGARGYVTLSRIAFDPDFTQALVYTEDHCGMWCAEGTYVLLQKEESSWKVACKLTLWVA